MPSATTTDRYLSVLRERRYGITQKKSLPTYVRYCIAAGVLAIAGFSALAISSHSQAILGYLQLWPQPERTTELFFANPEKLPRVVTPGQPFPIECTVRSREAASTSYSYAVEQVASPSTTLAKGTIQLAPHKQSTEKVNVTVPSIQGMNMIRIKVTYKIGDEKTTTQREISYWVKPRKET